MAAAVEWRREHNLERLPEIPGLSISELLSGLGTIYTFAYPEATARAASKHPGYIEIQHKRGSLYVPYNLTTFFPFAATLDELVGYAEAVQLSSTGVFISGSATFLGAPLVIGDLDLCAYVDRQCPKILERVRNLTEHDELFCAKLRWDEAMMERPWGNIGPVIQSAEAALQAGGFGKGQTWKLDFVVRSEKFGTLPLTILGIPVDLDDIETWAEGVSWSFQEALFIPSGQPLRSLALPDQLGEYALWLRGQIDIYLPNKPVKSAKRALCLTSLLLMGEESNALIEVLSAANVRPLVERDSLREVGDLLAGCTDGLGATLREEALKALAARGGPPRSEEYDSVHQECVTVTSQALSAIDQVLGAARRALRSRLS